MFAHPFGRLLYLALILALAGCEEHPTNFIERPGRAKPVAEPGDLDGSTGRATDGTTGMRAVTTTFASHVIEHQRLALDLDNASINQELVLRSESIEKAWSQTQITRPLAQENFRQGYPAGDKEEHFNQDGVKLLDILIVVDNSQSMEEEQNNLSERLAPLLSFVADNDWQIAVTTTDPNDVCIRALIKKSDAGVEEKFKLAVQAGIKGDGNERGILTAARALDASCLVQNGAWLRPLSNLAIVMVSDEDNCSDGNDCNGPERNASYLLDKMASIRTPGVDARVYGLFWHPSMAQDLCGTALHQARVYSELVEATKGTWGSICDDDFSTTLEDVSKNIAISLKSSFALTHEPEPSSVVVKINGVEMTTGFRVVNNVIEFTTPPVDGSEVQVNYRHAGEPMLAHFPLQYRPYPADAVVKIDGNALPQNAYVLDVARQLLVFAAVPPAHAQINVLYKREAALQTDFALGETVKAGSLVASVNGVATDAIQVDHERGIVRFSDAPPEGAKIDFTYLVAGNAILTYPVVIEDGALPSLVCFDAFSGAAVDVLYEEGVVAVGADDFADGRKLILRYDNLHRDQFAVTLPQAPLPETVVAYAGGSECSDALIISGADVFGGECGFASKVARVDFEYDYVAEERRAFAVTLPDWRPDLPGTWRVLVNGEVVDHFERDGLTIHFSEELPFQSEVVVEVIY